MTDEAARQAALEQKLQEHHGVDLPAVLETIAYLRDPNDTVLVGGSLAYGLGNARSDLDIVIAGPNTAESSSRMPLEHFLNGLRVDVWKLTAKEIDEIFTRAEECLASDAPFQGAFGDVFEQADLKLLHRLAYGVMIDGPPLRPIATRSYRDIARDIVMREYAERMRDATLTAQVALRAEQPLPAMTAARFAVEDALQVTVAARGVPFSDNKWLQTRLLSDASDLWPAYAPFRRLPAASEDAQAFVAEALETCQRLTGLALDLPTLMADAQWRNSDLRCLKIGADHVLVSPRHGVIWMLAESESTAFTGLGERDGWPCGECDAEQLRLCFELHLSGVVSLGWTRGLPTDALRVNEAVAE
jgi:Nucleotidyltransferase domain